MRVVVRMPPHLIERIDALCRNAPNNPFPMIASSNRLSGRVALMLSEETLEEIDEFRAASGLKSRSAAIRRLIEDALRIKQN